LLPRESEMFICIPVAMRPARRALPIALLDQVRLQHIFYGIAFFPIARKVCPRRPPAENFFNHGQQ